MKNITMKSIFRTLFLDKDGNFVVAQFPNPPILVWLGSLVGVRLVDDTTAQNVISSIGMISLIVWALLEVYNGVNLFRKLLGAGVLIGTIVGRIL